MSVNAMDVAKQLLYQASTNNCNITNLKLQKLIYFVNLTYISIIGEPLFSDKVKAWDLGPVVGTVYYNYKAFQDKIISEENVGTPNTMLSQICEFVLDIFGFQPASKLVDITHQDPIYEKAKQGDDKVMNHNKTEALNIIGKEIKTISQRAVYASLKEKITPSIDMQFLPYIDDYKDLSKEEIRAIWGLAK
jgi:uncharacterized phage-associated protein